MIQFVVESSSKITDGSLVYLPTDYAFSAKPRPQSTDSSACVNTLQLMVERGTSRVVFVEGYCPHPGWTIRRLAPPGSKRAGLRIVGVEFERGVAVPLNSYPENLWPTWVDPSTGWVCLERPGEQASVGCTAVEFAPGCVAVLDGGTLASLWLHPLGLPPI